MSRRFLMSIVALFLLSVAGIVSAGPKEDFIDQVVKQCSKSTADAEALCTPGRTGTVMRYSLCTEGTFDAGGGCTLKCTSKSGNVVGS